MLRISSALVALALATLSFHAPALATSSGPTSAPPGSLAFRVTADGVEAPDAPAAVLAEAFLATRDGASGPEATARLFAAVNGFPLLRGTVRAPVAAAAVAAADAWPGLAFPFPQGDADGDGLGDVLLFFPPLERGERGYTIRVVSQGELLWARSIDAVYADALPAVDMDGDGLTDVMLVELALSKGVVTSYEWRVSALRGADGAVIWTRAETGAFAEALSQEVVRGGVGASTAYAFVPLVGGDADGDGGADVWLNVISYGAAATENAYEDARLNRFALLSGATGAPLYAAALAAGPGGFVGFFPAGDFTGDGLADSILSQFDRDPASLAGASLVTALGGREPAPLWSRAFSGLAVGAPVTDFTGDRTAEALVYSIGPQSARIALDGTTGATLWSAADSFIYDVIPGNVDGVAGDDLLLLDTEWDSVLQVTALHLRALRGDNGRLVYDVKPLAIGIPDNGYSIVGVSPNAGDFDGDGVHESIAFVENGNMDARLNTVSALVGGSDGSTWWTIDDRDSFALPAGDVTGDGLADAALLHAPAGGTTKRLTSLEGLTGARGWSRAFEADQVEILAAGDLGGSATEDLLLGLLSDSAAYSTGIAAWNGEDGTTLWAA